MTGFRDTDLWLRIYEMELHLRELRCSSSPGTRTIFAFVALSDRFFIRILSFPRLSSLPHLYLIVIDFPSLCLFLHFATASPTIPPSFDSVNGSPQLDSIAVIR